jgi:hypothetical protein
MLRKRPTWCSCRGVELRRQNVDVGWREGRSEQLLPTPPLCPLGAANGDPRMSILAYGLQNKAKRTRLVPVLDDEMSHPTRFERVASSSGVGSAIRPKRTAACNPLTSLRSSRPSDVRNLRPLTPFTEAFGPTSVRGASHGRLRPMNAAATRPGGADGCPVHHPRV